MTQGYKKSLQPEEVARISQLELRARHVVEGFLSGLHRSPYFGQSIEFVQHREYVPGDDSRRIDWKVWSKTDKYYLKLYEEDTNLRTTILVDVSESMQFGSGKMTKYDYAATLAAALAYLLLRQQDSVGLVTFDEGVQKQIPYRTTSQHLHTLLAALETATTQRKTDIHKVLRQVAEHRSRRGMVILISDLFVDREGLFKGLGELRQFGHDVLVFHVLDDQELDFNFNGTTRFEGMEEQGDVTCDPRGLREGYLKAMDDFLSEVRRHCSRHVIDYQTIRTSDNFDATLMHYVNHRIGMSRSARS